MRYFLLLVYIEDRPTTDQRPTSHLGKFQMTISPRGVVRSTSCLVLRWGARGGGSNGAISDFAKSSHVAKFKWRYEYLRGGSSDLL